MNKANSRNSADANLEQIALQYLKKDEVRSVSQLHNALWLAHPSITKAETTDLVWRLVDQGEAELEYMPVASFVQFLRRWERNLGTYSSVAVSLAAILAIYAVPASMPFVVLRWIFGSAFVLFIPGYVATGTLFPRIGDLNSIERFALSIGLSLALVALNGFLLNYTPLGIRL